MFPRALSFSFLSLWGLVPVVDVFTEALSSLLSLSASPCPPTPPTSATAPLLLAVGRGNQHSNSHPNDRLSCCCYKPLKSFVHLFPVYNSLPVPYTRPGLPSAVTLLNLRLPVLRFSTSLMIAVIVAPRQLSAFLNWLPQFELPFACCRRPGKLFGQSLHYWGYSKMSSNINVTAAQKD